MLRVMLRIALALGLLPAVFRGWFGLVALALCLQFPALAVGQPTGPVLLTVGGLPSDTSDAAERRFDRAMLQALDWQEIETFTSFTEGPQRFAGPTLASLLDALGVTTGVLQATAVNDYSVNIPVAHARRHGILLAMDHDGVPMRLRDKGPIWVVYPLDAEGAANKLFDTKMIWQLFRLDLLP